MESLFGTDGIRGKANHYPITPEIALQVGRAVVSVLKTNTRSRIVIGKDGRISGDMLEAALAAGICSAGADVCLAGIIPTPAVAYLTADTGADAGIVVSASHNPYEDNGIKIFDSAGFKLDMNTEKRIEALVLAPDPEFAAATAEHVGTIHSMADARGRYTAFLKQSMGAADSLADMHLVIDCSNGATSTIAPRVFAELGASVTVLFDRPNGININAGCGSQYIETLQQTVRETGADAGLAFDGDGDRLIAVDETGSPVTGDHILAICARHMQQTGMLKNNHVVTTVMSNVGLIKALEQMGIEHLVTDVGDRYVLDRMRTAGAVLGGEDSGHMIFLDHHTSGDGIMTAIRLLEAMRCAQKPLSEMRNIMQVYPQVLKNVRIQQKTDIYRIPAIAKAIEKVESRLGSRGRVLVRYSGTQPLCRVMVEGPDADETDQLCQDIVDAVAEHLGAQA